MASGSQIAGNIVVCENRPFAFEAAPGNPDVSVPAGETTVEAIFGFGMNFGGASGRVIARGANRQVLLRWKVGQPDPQVRVGGWIADVTYERDMTVSEGTAVDLPAPYSTGRFSGQPYPGQRCYWYRVVKRTFGEPDPGFSTDPANVPFRRMFVTIASPVRAKTPLTTVGGTATNPVQPFHINAALISPYVVNVFPKVFYAR